MLLRKRERLRITDSFLSLSLSNGTSHRQVSFSIRSLDMMYEI